jgi:hypothetical protein
MILSQIRHEGEFAASRHQPLEALGESPDLRIRLLKSLPKHGLGRLTKHPTLAPYMGHTDC